MNISKMFFLGVITMLIVAGSLESTMAQTSGTTINPPSANSVSDQDRRNQESNEVFAAQIDPAEKALSMYQLRLSHLQIQRDVRIAMGRTLMELEERTGKQFTNGNVRLARTAAEMAANACHALYVSLLYKRATSAVLN